MATINLKTEIKAPIDRVFDLARSIDLHVQTAEQTQERALAGKTSGLIELGENVTWQAVHFGIKQRLTVEISHMNSPYFFEDQMISGAFKSMLHEHKFSFEAGVTVMQDIFTYKAPLGLIGRLVECTFLTAYLKKFLTKRNGVIKNIAETDEWKKYLE